MFARLAELEKKYDRLTELLGQEDVIRNQPEFQKLAREHSELDQLIALLREYRRTDDELAKTGTLLSGSDSDLREMARAELKSLQDKKESLEQAMKIMLIPKDPRDNRNIIMEIRAGAGGEEAALFAGVLFRMYSRFSELNGFKVDVLSTNVTGLGGMKEVIFEVKGDKVYSRFKFESGVHRVQRVPTTEASGRIHTSTVTVAVMPEAEEVDIVVNPQDLKIDTYRSGGAGGQNVNKLETAIRITHLPSGMVICCQDEQSQIQNKQRALKILRARLLEQKEAQHHASMAREKKKQVGTGERCEKIRTYNFPQNRITDHRIGLSVHNMQQVLDGALEEIVSSLATDEQGRKLADISE
ncbi:MAG: peptide chain release factor 1 [Candidatus Wallbacteria bacterium]|nr:peptide chain release factor 1 [Candidatus Wallbacteria bacterium]